MKGKYYTPSRRQHVNRIQSPSSSPFLFIPREESPTNPSSSSYVQEAITSRKLAMDCARATLNTAKQLRSQIKEKDTLISELKDIIIVLKENLDEVEHKKEVLLDQIATTNNNNNNNRNNIIIHKTIETQTKHQGLRNIVLLVDEKEHVNYLKNNNNLKEMQEYINVNTQTDINLSKFKDNEILKKSNQFIEKAIMVDMKKKCDTCIKRNSNQYVNFGINTLKKLTHEIQTQTMKIQKQTINRGVSTLKLPSNKPTLEDAISQTDLISSMVELIDESAAESIFRCMYQPIN